MDMQIDLRIMAKGIEQEVLVAHLPDLTRRLSVQQWGIILDRRRLTNQSEPSELIGEFISERADICKEIDLLLIRLNLAHLAKYLSIAVFGETGTQSGFTLESKDIRALMATNFGIDFQSYS